MFPKTCCLQSPKPFTPWGSGLKIENRPQSHERALAVKLLGHLGKKMRAGAPSSALSRPGGVFSGPREVLVPAVRAVGAHGEASSGRGGGGCCCLQISDRLLLTEDPRKKTSAQERCGREIVVHEQEETSTPFYPNVVCPGRAPLQARERGRRGSHRPQRLQNESV